jgi:hypothetical protein
MIKSILIFFIIFNLFGFGYLAKKFFFFKNKEFEYIDLFLGFFLLVFLLVFFRFIFPIKVMVYPILILGLFLSIFYFKKIQHLLTFNFFLIILTVGILIESNPFAGDSHLYHLQLIRWYSDEKIVFGLANLEKRFGHFSVWHIFISLFNFELFKINLIYLVSTIPFIIITSHVISLKIKKIFFFHNIFLIFSLLLIIYFSIIHPSYNGPIFNHMGSVEVDTIGVYFFLISFYYFLKFFESENQKDFIYLTIFIILSYQIKISNALLVLLLLFCIYKKSIDFKNLKLFFFSIVLINLIWVLSNLITSGCIIYPVKSLCFNFIWALPLEKVDFLAKETMAFARSKENINFNYMNFDYYLKSLKWVFPWFRNFFIQISFIQITFFILIFSISALAVNKFKKIRNVKLPYVFIFIFLILNILYWLLAPDMRFAYGIFTALSIFVFSLLFYSINIKLKQYLKFYKIFFLLSFVLLIFKNIKYQSKENVFFEKRNFNYSSIKFLKKVNNFEIYQSFSGDCNLFKKICVYDLPKDLQIKDKLNYLVISQ